MRDNMKEHKYRAWDKRKQSMMYGNSYIFHVNKELMLSTGLADKNGKEIFEGDVLKPDTLALSNAVVYWNESGARFNIRHSRRPSDGKILNTSVNKNMFAKYEIIGDIYTTPELVDNSHK